MFATTTAEKPPSRNEMYLDLSGKKNVKQSRSAFIMESYNCLNHPKVFQWLQEKPDVEVFL